MTQSTQSTPKNAPGLGPWLGQAYTDHMPDIGRAVTLLTGRAYGPLVSSAVKTGLGGGLGMGAAYLMASDPERRKRLMKTLGLMGAGAGLGWGALDTYGTYKSRNDQELKSHGLPWYLTPYPYLKKGSADAFGSLLPYDEDLPDWAPPGWDTPLTTDSIASTILEDQSLSMGEKGDVLNHLSLAEMQGGRGGLVSTPDLVRAGVGYWGGKAAGGVAGKVLAAMGVIPEGSRKTLGRMGAIGGLLRATGIWQ